MSENEANRSDTSPALEGSKSTTKRARQFDSKLRSTIKQFFKPSGASVWLKDSSEAVSSIRGRFPEVHSELEKDARPSNASAASYSLNRRQVSVCESLSKLSSKVEKDSKRDGALTASKHTSSTVVPTGGSFSKLVSKLRKHRSNVECQLRYPLKPPIIRSRTYPGPSNLAQLCKQSTVQLVLAKDLDTLSKYWHFRDNFDRLARRSYRQGEEIECLLRRTKLSPRLIGAHGNLVFAHELLHKQLDRLHCCIKEEETDLDEDMARIVMDKMKIFMEKLESLTADLQLTCQALDDIFDESIISKGSLERCMPNPRMVFPEWLECQFKGTCWDLHRAVWPLIEAIKCEGRKRKHEALEAVAAEPMKE
jgi:hypothetical protein